MNKEQALQNLENLINVAIQRGLFQTSNDVVGIVQSLDVLRGIQTGENYVATTSDGRIPTFNHVPEKEDK